MKNRIIEMPVFSLAGKSVIVTGGSKGIGFGVAATFAHYGANVIITARTAADVEAAAEDINQNYAQGGVCYGMAADSGKQEDIDRIVAAAVEKFGQLDILINNAGITGESALILDDRCNAGNFDKVVATNLRGAFLFSKAAAKQMVAQGIGGKIINMASMFAFMGEKGMVVYSATKSAVVSMTKTMAAEWARYGIYVNAVCPGYTVTPINEEFLSDEATYKRIASRTALRRLGTIEEIAGPVCALACDCFSYMTGTTLVLDGGQTIGS